MPLYCSVDVNIGTTTWSPTCLVTPKAQNAAMQASAENVETLFDIVQGQINKPCDGRASVHTPTRKLRRRTSDPYYKRGSPNSREYYVRSKGWVQCKKEKGTPGSGSGSNDAKLRRRFIVAAAEPTKKKEAKASGSTGPSRQATPPRATRSAKKHHRQG